MRKKSRCRLCRTGVLLSGGLVLTVPCDTATKYSLHSCVQAAIACAHGTNPQSAHIPRAMLAHTSSMIARIMVPTVISSRFTVFLVPAQRIRSPRSEQPHSNQPAKSAAPTMRNPRATP